MIVSDLIEMLDEMPPGSVVELLTPNSMQPLQSVHGGGKFLPGVVILSTREHAPTEAEIRALRGR